MGIEDKVKDEEQDEIEIESDIPNNTTKYNTTKKIAGVILGIGALGMAITGYFVKDELSKGISYFMSGFTTASFLFSWVYINKNNIKCGHPDCERARENAKKIYKASGIEYPSPEDDPCVSFKPHLMSKSCTKYKKYDGK